MIEVSSVSKTIHGVEVLRNVSAHFEAGRVSGLAGPNGSGKTMLMRAILGLIRPTSGWIEIDGARLWRDIAFPPSVGVLLENPAFLDAQSGLQNLLTLARIKGIATENDCRNAIAASGLDPDDKRKYRKYSLGMKQRLALAAATMESPDVLILDGPTNALDPQGVACAKSLVRAAADCGATVIIACHDADVMHELADEVWHLAEGRNISHEVLRPKDESIPQEEDASHEQSAEV